MQPAIHDFLLQVITDEGLFADFDEPSTNPDALSSLFNTEVNDFEAERVLDAFSAMTDLYSWENEKVPGDGNGK